MILYNSESNIRDTWPFCPTLSFLTAVLWNMLQPSCSSEAVISLDYQLLLKSPPPNLTGWIRPWSHSHQQLIFKLVETLLQIHTCFFSHSRNVRSLPLSAVTSRCITVQVCVQQCNKTPAATVTCTKTPAIVTWSEPLKICCYAIVTQ